MLLQLEGTEHFILSISFNRHSDGVGLFIMIITYLLFFSLK